MFIVVTLLFIFCKKNFHHLPQFLFVKGYNSSQKYGRKWELWLYFPFSTYTVAPEQQIISRVVTYILLSSFPEH